MVQDGDSTVYAYKVEPDQVQQQIVVTTDSGQILQVTADRSSDGEQPLTVIEQSELEVQNSW